MVSEKKQKEQNAPKILRTIKGILNMGISTKIIIELVAILVSKWRIKIIVYTVQKVITIKVSIPF